MRCYNAGRTDNEQLKIELLSQWKLETEFRNLNTLGYFLSGESKRKERPQKQKKKRDYVGTIPKQGGGGGPLFPLLF